MSEFAKRNAKKGDLVVAMLPDGEKPVWGVVGDLGPPGQLGEASIAMNGKLLGKQAQPVNYLEVRGKPPFVGKGWVAPATFMIVFAGSRDMESPYMTTDRIDPEASARFAAWGGLARAKSCIQAYRAAQH